jgi:hypothetical protein
MHARCHPHEPRFTDFERRSAPPPLRSDALEAAHGAKALFRLTREFRDTFGTPWRRDIGSGPREDPQPRAAAARRISSTTDA